MESSVARAVHGRDKAVSSSEQQMGHQSTVTALATVLYDLNDAVVSVCSSGTLCVWDAADGLCLASSSSRLLEEYSPTSISALPDRRHVVVAGNHTDVVVLDVWKMTITSIIRGHNDWVSGVFPCSLRVSEQDPVVLSLSADGVLRFWAVGIGHEDLPVQTVVLPAAAGHKFVVNEEAMDDDGPPVSGELNGSAGAHGGEPQVSASTSAANTSTSGKEGEESATLADSAAEEEEALSRVKRGRSISTKLRSRSGSILATPIDAACSPNDHYVSVDLAPDCTTFLCVTRRHWIVFTAQNAHKVFEVACPFASGWGGGVFVDDVNLLLWTRDGRCCMYRLPDTSHYPAVSFSTERTSSGDSPLKSRVHKPHLYYYFTRPDFECSNSDHQMLSSLISSAERKYDRLRHGRFVGAVSTDKQYLLVGDENGGLFCWRVPGFKKRQRAAAAANLNVGRRQFTQSRNDSDSGEDGSQPDLRSMNELPSMASRAASDGSSPRVSGDGDPREVPFDVSSVSAGESCEWSDEEEEDSKIETLSNQRRWNRVINRHVHAVGAFSDGWQDLDEDRAAVTASYILEEAMILVRGYSDGKMSLHRLPTDPSPRFLRGHRGSRVNALFCASCKDYSRVIVSGGEDCTIRVWSLDSGEELHTWNQHSDGISNLYPLPNGMDSEWRSKFLSISKDLSVGLFSLRTMHCLQMFTGHPAPITDVRLRLDQDYLLVRCEDTSVSVWEMSTGQLEGCICGPESKEITETAVDISNMRSQRPKAMQSQGLSAITITGIDGDCPTEIVMLNVKHLIQELYLKMRECVVRSSADADAAPAKPSTGPGRPTFVPQAVHTVMQASVGSVADLLQCPAYLIYTYLLPWGLDPDMDAEMESALQLRPPNPPTSLCARGHKGKLTMMTPAFSTPQSRYSTSSLVTALHMLAAVAYTKSLLQIGEAKNTFSSILSFFCALLPDRVERYMVPSLSFLTNYWQDVIDDVSQSTRSIFDATLDRQSPYDREEFVSQWALRLESSSRRGMKTRALAVVVLGILGAERAGSMSPELQAKVAAGLQELLFQDQISLQMFATEILGKGYETWRAHVKSHAPIILKLFSLSLVQDPPMIAKFAYHALMQIGAAEPVQFVVTLAEHPMKGARQFDTKEYGQALSIIGSLVKKKPVSLLSELPRLVETVVQTLDPNVPSLRDSCMKAATSVLHSIVSKFPMISFHQPSQRLAVGTSRGTICIYDLKSASKVHVLDAFSSAVTALAYSRDGKWRCQMLACYSIYEGQVRLWETQAQFFGFGTNPRCRYKFPVQKPNRSFQPRQLLENVRLEWAAARALILVRGWEGSVTFQL